MALFSTPETHAANPPESWSVQKIQAGLWALTTADGDAQNAGDRLETFPTMRQAQEARVNGWSARLWHKEECWYAGGTIAGWKSWAECKAEQERTTARINARMTARALEGAL